MDWTLPTEGPKTLNGLLTELLDMIPEKNVCVRLPEHYAEILNVKDNAIKTVKMRSLSMKEAGAAQQGKLFH